MLIDMSKEKLRPFHFSNSRIVYAEEVGLPKSWINRANEINMFINNHPSLSNASDSIYLYFFDYPDEIDPELCESWVAREIIGHPGQDLGEEYEELDWSDFDSGEGVSLRETIQIDNDLFGQSNELMKISSEVFQNAKNAGEFAPTWRVKLTPPGKNGKAWNLDIQLFAVL